MGTGNEDRFKGIGVADPAWDDPRYWDRFHAAVLARAVFELATRRRQAQQPVAAVLSSWSRSLIPVALAAAVIAALLIGSEANRGPAPAAPPLALEDVLGDEVGDGSFQAVMQGELHASPIAFMALVEGNDP